MIFNRYEWIEYGGIFLSVVLAILAGRADIWWCAIGFGVCALLFLARALLRVIDEHA
jgi:hypothetical protein